MTRSGNLGPAIRVAQTRGMPSARTSDPLSMSSARGGLRAPALAMSAFTVMTVPPRPVAHASRTMLITSRSVNGSSQMFPTLIRAPLLTAVPMGAAYEPTSCSLALKSAQP